MPRTSNSGLKSGAFSILSIAVPKLCRKSPGEAVAETKRGSKQYCVCCSIPKPVCCLFVQILSDMPATGTVQQSLQNTRHRGAIAQFLAIGRRMLESWLLAEPAMLSLACWVARKAAWSYHRLRKVETVMSMRIAMMLIVVILWYGDGWGIQERRIDM